MENNQLDKTLLREMFNRIRSAEIKNIKTQTYADRQMVTSITKYIMKQVEKEAQNDENKKYETP